MSLNESIVEDAALEWFGELGYAVGHGPHIAPGEYAEGTLTPALSRSTGRGRDAKNRGDALRPTMGGDFVAKPRNMNLHSDLRRFWQSERP